MHKKILALLCLTLSIVLLGITAFAAETAETAETNVIYVSGTATEGGTGSASTPVGSLAEAYTLLGNNGTIYLLDSVTVSATEGDCFIAPTHAGKITVKSAPNANGALDLTGVKHFHFGGTTEWNDLEIIANEVVLTADKHALTMGEGLTVSSPSDETLYRGGHEYCAARVNLTSYAVCSTADVACTRASGALYVHSGEYWSVSTWYGGAITVKNGEAQIYLGTKNETDSIWVRYLCPGLFNATPDKPLTCTNAMLTVFVDEGVNTTEVFRFTQNTFAGNATVNWLLSAPVQGDASVLAAQGFFAEDNAMCTLNMYVTPLDTDAQTNATLLMRGNANASVGEQYTDLADYHTELGYHFYEAQNDGWLRCIFCSHLQCPHRYSEYITLQEYNCIQTGEVRLQCTDFCGEYLDDPIYYDIDMNMHRSLRTSYDPNKDVTGLRCVDCDALFGLMDGCPQPDVYVGKSTGTPIAGDNISEHFTDTTQQIGCSTEYSFANFEDAMRYAAMASKYNDSVTLHILDDAYVPSGYITPVLDGTLTITGGTLHFDGEEKFFRMAGDVTFENITFMSTNYTDEDFTLICARNHKLVMGEGIVMGNADTVATEGDFPNCNSVRMKVIGGFNGPSDYEMATDITIRSGDYWYIGGWNYNASTNDGTSKITIGKTNDADKLQVFYLSPFSRGDGFITKVAKGTIIVDGDVQVKRFTVTTLNDATTDIRYETTVVLRGNIIGCNEEDPQLGYDVYGCPPPYPQTTINLYVDESVATAVEDSYVFLGHPDGTYDRDISLDRLNATVNVYSYAEYAQE